MASTVSNISQALAANNARIAHDDTTSVSNPDGSGAAAAVKGASLGALGLPTPPNSISPHLPALPYRETKHPSESAASPLSQIDSDIDLQDEVDYANGRDRPVHRHADFGPDSAPGAAKGMGTVTAMLLAKRHLAELLVERGPLKVKHMLNHLHATVPGFSDIADTKARRIVNAALENRAGGGANGEVEFERVGWGCWRARVKSQTPTSKGQRMIYPIREVGGSGDARSAPAGALRIPNSKARRPSKPRRSSYGSFPGEGTLAVKLEASEHEQGHKDVAEHEADKMSIDGDEEDEARQSQPLRSRYSIGRRSVPENYSDTDEEDWASCGVEALRAGSISSSAGGGLSRSAVHNHMRQGLNRRPSAFARLPQSAPGGSAVLHHHREQQENIHDAGDKVKDVDFTGVDANDEEREAIVALLSMVSAQKRDD